MNFPCHRGKGKGEVCRWGDYRRRVRNLLTQIGH